MSMVLPFIMACYCTTGWVCLQVEVCIPQNTFVVTDHKVCTDPLRAILQYVKLLIILDNHPNLNESETIAFLAITTTIVPVPIGPFLDNTS